MNGLWQPQGRAASAARAIRILIMASMLSSCSWFDSGSKPNDQSASFPNLGTVPTSTPATASNAQRQQIAQGLIADQQNAAYSADQLTAGANAGGVPPPEAPPPTPVPTAGGDSTSAETSQAQTATKQPETTGETGQAVVADSTNAASSQASAPTQSAEAPAKPSTDIAGASPVASPSAPSSTGTQTAQQPVAPVSMAETATNDSQSAAQPSPIAPMQSTGLEPAPQEAQPAPPLDLAPPVPIAPPPSVSATSTDQNEPAAASAPAAAPLPFTIASLAPAQGSIVGSGRPVAIIFFADGSAGLSYHDLSVLHDVLLVQKQQGGHLRVVGHASGSPASSDEARQKLDYDVSLARAKAVSRAFARLGASADAIAVSAAGAKEPMFAESAPTGEAGNRRVEIFLDR
jgi:flagellar motor protein MotB